MNIFLLQGPNLNYLGKRQPEFYGHTSAAELDELLYADAQKHNYNLTIFYSNCEGKALDRLYEEIEADRLDGLVMNPAAWSVGGGTSMRFCLLSINRPYIEVHIRNQYAMKVSSTLADLAIGVVQGFGLDSYFLALEGMRRHLQKSASRPT